jgi:preprotein translocase subunit YajC
MPNLLQLPFLLLQDGAAPGAGTTGAPTAQPGVMESLFGSMLFPLILCFGVFWLLILRPESKNRKKRLEMLNALKKGDKVQTSGGLYGTVVQVQEQVVTLQVDEGVRMRFALSAIAAVVDESGASAADAKK